MEPITVDTESAGTRLDIHLRSVLSISRAQLVKNIAGIQVNGKSVKPSMRLSAGDVITVALLPPAESDVLPENIPLPIVYEDDAIVVINKPAGMASHASDHEKSGSVVNAVLFHCRDMQFYGDTSRAGIVHRLDKDTSGIMVVGKSPTAVEALQQQFAARTVEKIYHAIVAGTVEHEHGIVDAAIGRHPRYRKKMTVRADGRAARTIYDVLERLRGATLVRLTPRTGRTHQLRVHLASIRHPIIGDRIYSKTAKDYRMKGLALVAKKLSFDHPVTKERVSFEIEYPEDFKEWLTRLRG
ncbi:MAG: RluA family pseudouridine synthase [Spirochaetota bacterium]